MLLFSIHCIQGQRPGTLLVYITLKDGDGDFRGSRAPRATYHIPLEPSGPRDSRAPGATRARARREKLIFWPQIPTCGVSLEPG